MYIILFIYVMITELFPKGADAAATAKLSAQGLSALVYIYIYMIYIYICIERERERD